MNTAPDLNKPTAIAATGQTKAAAAVRIKLLSHGFSIDHPDPELGEQLMADALGVGAELIAVSLAVGREKKHTVGGGCETTGQSTTKRTCIKKRAEALSNQYRR